MNIPLSSDIDYIMKENRKTLDSGMSLVVLRFGTWVVTFIGSLPEALGRLVMLDNSSKINMIISNTPGPKDPVYF